MKILTGGQFRELDLYTIEHEGVSSLELMERASRAVADEILRRWPSTERRVFVFAGPGGNGGDGLAVARMLADAGRIVTAYLFNVRGHLNPDCEANRDVLLQREDVQLVEVTTELLFPELHPDDLVIDALFGTGLSKPLSGGFALVCKRLNQSQATIVSIDLPSGLMCEDNSYNDVTCVVRATATLSIQQPKLAFFFPENQRFVGDFVLLPIGLSAEGLDAMKTHLWITEQEDIHSLLRRRSRFAHKGTMGHGLLVAGSRGMAGAAILASRAALRGGLGKLTLHTPYACLDIIQNSVPEAIVQMDVDSDRITSAVDATNFQAIGIGPGLGRSRYTAAALHDYLLQQTGPMVLDADALNLLAEKKEWLSDVPPESILTPHPRELDRLAGSSQSSFERMNRARDLAITRGIFVVVKGHYSQICTPSGDVYFNPTGNPGMATAGSGDVLTGLLTALLAQGYLPAEAVQLGVYLHGLAGDLAAAALCEESLIASDIISYLPAAFRKLHEGATEADATRSTPFQEEGK
ncbi:MAG: NAD(P)H-hydrate dehydratase [Bacteroidaceae bacterium]|nr:NAD(P)H-hydrate dehydratase [Bacteroidaceae bacterium]